MNPLQAHDFSRLARVDRLIGVDEAGRGCLAGPVFAAACLVQPELFEDPEALQGSSGVNDSKKLSARSRESLYGILLALRGEGLLDLVVAEASVVEIDQLNILGATRLAMRRALEQVESNGEGWALPATAACGPLFDADRAERAAVCLLVDGRPLRPFAYEHEALVKGDGKSLAIAAAGIAAKVERDRRMGELAKRHPEYGFDRHCGYATGAHREAIRRYGPCPEHRPLFLRKILS